LINVPKSIDTALFLIVFDKINLRLLKRILQITPFQL
jgi:hypothetical protein